MEDGFSLVGQPGIKEAYPELIFLSDVLGMTPLSTFYTLYPVAKENNF